jgi:hypothetical protein
MGAQEPAAAAAGAVPIQSNGQAPNVWCRCGRPARGEVPASSECPAHFCRQCSPSHCEMAAYLRGT